MTRNDRRVAIITGGSRGIGAGLVAGYRGRGWAVVANAVTIEPSADPGVLTVEGDIAERGTADRVVEGALERFGRIDKLVNNAGVFVTPDVVARIGRYEQAVRRLQSPHRRTPQRARPDGAPG